MYSVSFLVISYNNSAKSDLNNSIHNMFMFMFMFYSRHPQGHSRPLLKGVPCQDWWPWQAPEGRSAGQACLWQGQQEETPQGGSHSTPLQFSALARAKFFCPSGSERSGGKGWRGPPTNFELAVNIISFDGTLALKTSKSDAKRNSIHNIIQ